jgi:hypothetical protein
LKLVFGSAYRVLYRSYYRENSEVRTQDLEEKGKNEEFFTVSVSTVS